MDDRYIREEHGTREEWLEARRSMPGSLGASDAGALLGISPWRTIDDLYDEALGLKAPKDLSKNPAVRFGTKAEASIRELVALDLADILTVEHHPYDILRLKDAPYIFCTLDGDLSRKSDGARGVLEIKTGRYNPDWEDGLPAYYYAQVCQQLLVTGWDFAIVAGRLTQGRPSLSGEWANLPARFPQVVWVYRYIDAKDPAVAKSMRTIRAAAEEYHKHVQQGRRPATRVAFGKKTEAKEGFFTW